MNAVIYARYSSDNQREESIEGQLRECSEFAERKGYTVIILYNYKDGEDCVPHSVIREYIGKKENSDGHDRRSSLIDCFGTPSGIRKLPKSFCNIA